MKKLREFLDNPLMLTLAVLIIAVNLSALVVFGIIPKKDDSDEFADSRAVMVNINTATISELTVLDGIGYNRAEDIVNYRQRHGDFKSIRDIMNVPGIGEGIFNDIRNQIYV